MLRRAARIGRSEVRWNDAGLRLKLNGIVPGAVIEKG